MSIDSVLTYCSQILLLYLLGPDFFGDDPLFPVTFQEKAVLDGLDFDCTEFHMPFSKFNYKTAFKKHFRKLVLAERRMTPSERGARIVVLRNFFRFSFTSGIDNVPVALSYPVKYI